MDPETTFWEGPESASAEPSKSPLGVSTWAAAKGQVRPEQSASCQFGKQAHSSKAPHEPWPEHACAFFYGLVRPALERSLLFHAFLAPGAARSARYGFGSVPARGVGGALVRWVWVYSSLAPGAGGPRGRGSSRGAFVCFRGSGGARARVEVAGAASCGALPGGSLSLAGLCCNAAAHVRALGDGRAGG